MHTHILFTRILYVYILYVYTYIYIYTYIYTFILYIYIHIHTHVYIHKNLSPISPEANLHQKKDTIQMHSPVAARLESIHGSFLGWHLHDRCYYTAAVKVHPQPGNKTKNMAGWWLGHLSEKYESQLG